MKKILQRLLLLVAGARAGARRGGKAHARPRARSTCTTGRRCSAARRSSSTTASTATAPPTCATTGCSDLGLTEQQIRDNLHVHRRQGRRADDDRDGPGRIAKEWFGVVAAGPVASSRARAAPTGSTPTCAASTATRRPRPAGTTLVFPNVGMPHVLWELQGEQVLKVTERMDPNTGDMKHDAASWCSSRPGTLTPRRVRPAGRRPGELPGLHGRARAGTSARRSGILVLFFLGVLFVLA